VLHGASRDHEPCARRASDAPRFVVARSAKHDGLEIFCQKVPADAATAASTAASAETLLAMIEEAKRRCRRMKISSALSF
jgi:hypothetical protein